MFIKLLAVVDTFLYQKLTSSTSHCNYNQYFVSLISLFFKKPLKPRVSQHVLARPRSEAYTLLTCGGGETLNATTVRTRSCGGTISTPNASEDCRVNNLFAAPSLPPATHAAHRLIIKQASSASAAPDSRGVYPRHLSPCALILFFGRDNELQIISRKRSFSGQ